MPTMFNIKNIFKKKDALLHSEKKSVFSKKKSDVAESEKGIEFFKKKYKALQQKRLIKQERKQRLKDYLERAGLEINHEKLSKIFFDLAVLINLLVSAYLIYYFSTTYGIDWGTIVASMVVLWIFVFILLIFALWILFYIAVDFKIFKRKIDIEDVLPDFLQLTASNINAGMTIDKALWYAVRPRFGVLAKEIEMVAKETMSGVDLKIALERFAARYDSVILKRSINMLNEGLQAGGRIGDLLNRIAVNIQEQKTLVKEMSANVTTYVIFITFATIVAAPFLFALSGVLINVVQNLGTALSGTSAAAANVPLGISFSGVGVTPSDFKAFAITSLTITSFFSALMISTIKKGNMKSGFRFIPIFIIISLTIYLVIQSVAGNVIGIFI